VELDLQTGSEVKKVVVNGQSVKVKELEKEWHAGTYEIVISF